MKLKLRIDLPFLRKVVGLLLCIIIINITIILISGTISSQRVYNTSSALNASRLNAAVTQSESIMSVSKLTLNSIARNVSIQRLSVQRNTSWVADFFNAHAMMVDAYNSHGLFSTLFVYYSKYDEVLDSTGIRPATEVNNWAELLKDKNGFINVSFFTVLSDNSDYHIYYCKPLTWNTTSYVIGEIDMSNINRVLSKTYAYKDEAIVIEMPDGYCLTPNHEFSAYVKTVSASDPSSILINGKEYVVTSCHSDELDWTFWQFIPKDEIRNAMNPLDRINRFVMAGLCVLAVFVVFLFITSIYSPINNLYKSISTDDSTSNHIQYINEYIKNIIDDNDRLKELINPNVQYLRNSLLLNLVVSPFGDREREHLEQIGVKLDKRFFRIVVFEIKDDCTNLNDTEYLKTALYRDTIEKGCQQILSQNYTVQFEPLRFFTILSYDDMPEEELCNNLRQLLESAQSEYGILMLAGISSEKPSHTQLQRAFIEANSICSDLKLTAADSIGVYTHDKSSAGDVVLYPYALDDAVVFAMRNCNATQLSEALRAFANHLRYIPAINEYMVRQFYLTLLSDITRSSENYSAPDVPDLINLSHDVIIKFSSAHTIDEYDDAMNGFALSLLKRSSTQSSGRRRQLLDDEMTYIKQNYSKHIGVSDIASALGISAAYLSKITKEETGLSPTDLLNEARIMNAADKLRNSLTNADEIGRLCGFLSKQTYYRQFKAFFHCTPTQYRARYRIRKTVSPKDTISIDEESKNQSIRFL